MRYTKTVVLKGGVELLVRNAVASDARALRETTQRTHAETDYLLSYPDEQGTDDEREAALWRKRNVVAMRLSSSQSSMGGLLEVQGCQQCAVGARSRTGRVLGSASSRSTGGWGSAGC